MSLQMHWEVGNGNAAHLTENELNALKSAYYESFPEQERRPWSSICTMQNLSFRFVAIREAGELVGFVTLWLLSGFVYVEHLLVMARYRGVGMGGRIVHALHERYSSLPIVLEVEPADMGLMARRRINFYQRLGFKVQSIDYMQPPYTPLGASIPLLLMSSQDMTKVELERVAGLIHREVYGVES